MRRSAKHSASGPVTIKDIALRLDISPSTVGPERSAAPRFDVQALYQAAKHLLELGHRRIAYIGSSAQLPTGRSRVEGFQAALAGVDGAQGIEALGTPASKSFARSAMRRLVRGSTSPLHGSGEALEKRQL